MALRPVAHQRFVSKPLPDGSRYTFLYPAHLKNVEQQSWPMPYDQFPSYTTKIWISDPAPSCWDKVRRRLGLSVLSSAERVHVVTFPLSNDKIKNDRQNERWVADGEWRQSEYVWDARTRTLFWLAHCCPRSAAAQFKEHAPVIAHSFRVLPPGVPVPKP